MFFVVLEKDKPAHGPFATQRIAALWACDNCSNIWIVRRVNIAKGAERYMDHLQEQLNASEREREEPSVPFRL